MAERVMRMPEPSPAASGPATAPTGNALQRKCPRCETEDKLQRKTAGAPIGEMAAPPIVHDVLRSPGQPLDPATRTFMEPRFGHDFGQVRVHTDANAIESARAIAAQAYTVGVHVAFAEGRYAPETTAGRRLLAHELTHVVQQAAESTVTPTRLAVKGDTSPLERAADASADAAVAGTLSRITGPVGHTQVQRHKDDQVAYSGGQQGILLVIRAGKLIGIAPAISGHPGHGEYEPAEGPIPTGKYAMHPAIIRPTVSTVQNPESGINRIMSGYQEITSTVPIPCSGEHYCNVPCPTASDPSQMCFTLRDVWGPKRIKIEGSATVALPTGGKVVRDGFYIHGGNAKDAVSAGCIKSLYDGVFSQIRLLTGVGGMVPLCVGNACPPSVSRAIIDAGINKIIELIAASEPPPVH